MADRGLAAVVARGMAVYLHYPYCARLCSYCDFNKYLFRDVDHDRMTACYARDTANQMKDIPHTLGPVSYTHLTLPTIYSV